MGGGGGGGGGVAAKSPLLVMACPGAARGRQELKERDEPVEKREPEEPGEKQEPEKAQKVASGVVVPGRRKLPPPLAPMVWEALVRHAASG